MLDALGILIGFVSVILILSLVTTSLVQASSSLLRLRGRNLSRGLAILLDAAKPAGGTPEETSMNSSELTQKVLTAPELMNLGRNLVPSIIPAWLRSTSQTWIDSDQLKAILENTKDLPAGLADKAVELFPQLEKATTRRFAFFMRVNSLIWALAVAILFQISTPDLLRSLSADEELRAALVDSVEDMVEYPDVAGQAFERLKADNAALADTEWAPSAATDSRAEILASLRAEIGGIEGSEALVGQYADTLDDLYLEQLKSSVAQLGELDIRPWSKGLEFYWTSEGLRVENVLGVLITAALLTLGAPFWFKALKNLSGLRDLLSPLRRDDDGGGQGQGQPDRPGA